MQLQSRQFVPGVFLILAVITLHASSSFQQEGGDVQHIASSNDTEIATTEGNEIAEIAPSLAIDGSEIDVYALPPNDEARLLHTLIKRYHGYGLARPVAEVSKTLDVSLLFVINEFLGIEELTGIMKVTAVVIATWQDDLLRWDPNDFNQLKAVPMRTRDVFLPTIIKDGNGGTQASIFMTGSGQNDRDINSMVWVEHSGRVEAKVTSYYATSCTLNLADFPFDKQTCEFTFRSWRFSNKRITLHQARGQKISEHITDSFEVNINANANWMMDSITSEDTTLIGVSENYSAITYTVIASRRSEYYTWNVLMPSIAMAVLLLATFFMPFGPERSMFCITMVLTMNIFQQALTAKLPVTAEVIPYVRQTTAQVMMGILITIESAFVWWLAAKDKRCAVPMWLRNCIPALRRRLRIEKEKLAAKGLLLVGKGKVIIGKTDVEHMENGANGQSTIFNRNPASEAPSLIGSRRHSINSQRNGGTAGHADDATLIGEDFIIWGEWLEVAQICDLIMLMITVGSMLLLPIFFYRHRF